MGMEGEHFILRVNVNIVNSMFVTYFNTMPPRQSCMQVVGYISFAEAFMLG